MFQLPSLSGAFLFCTVPCALRPFFFFLVQDCARSGVPARFSNMATSSRSPCVTSLLFRLSSSPSTASKKSVAFPHLPLALITFAQRWTYLLRPLFLDPYFTNVLCRAFVVLSSSSRIMPGRGSSCPFSVCYVAHISYPFCHDTRI